MPPGGAGDPPGKADPDPVRLGWWFVRRGHHPPGPGQPLSRGPFPGGHPLHGYPSRIRRSLFFEPHPPGPGLGKGRPASFSFPPTLGSGRGGRAPRRGEHSGGVPPSGRVQGEGEVARGPDLVRGGVQGLGPGRVGSVQRLSGGYPPRLSSPDPDPGRILLHRPPFCPPFREWVGPFCRLPEVGGGGGGSREPEPGIS